MKKLLTFALLLFIVSVFAQDKMVTKNGKIIFEASIPAFEEVKAKTNQASCVLNTKTGDIASLALIKAFEFKLALMQEHFNANYLESDSYPKSTFKGKIQNFHLEALTPVAQEYTITGKMELHGKTKNVVTIAKIRKSEDNSIEIISDFNINASDYDIEIPAIVKTKVSDKVCIRTNFQLK